MVEIGCVFTRHRTASSACLMVKPGDQLWSMSRQSRPSTETLQWSVAASNLSKISLATELWWGSRRVFTERRNESHPRCRERIVSRDVDGNQPPTTASNLFRDSDVPGNSVVLGLLVCTYVPFAYGQAPHAANHSAPGSPRCSHKQSLRAIPGDQFVVAFACVLYLQHCLPLERLFRRDEHTPSLLRSDRNMSSKMSEKSGSNCSKVQ